jgi:hypothetical protein
MAKHARRIVAITVASAAHFVAFAALWNAAGPTLPQAIAKADSSRAMVGVFSVSRATTRATSRELVREALPPRVGTAQRKASAAKVQAQALASSAADIDPVADSVAVSPSPAGPSGPSQQLFTIELFDPNLPGASPMSALLVRQADPAQTEPRDHWKLRISPGADTIELERAANVQSGRWEVALEGELPWYLFGVVRHALQADPELARAGAVLRLQTAQGHLELKVLEPQELTLAGGSYMSLPLAMQRAGQWVPVLWLAQALGYQVLQQRFELDGRAWVMRMPHPQML